MLKQQAIQTSFAVEGVERVKPPVIVQPVIVNPIPLYNDEGEKLVQTPIKQQAAKPKSKPKPATQPSLQEHACSVMGICCSFICCPCCCLLNFLLWAGTRFVKTKQAVLNDRNATQWHK